MLQNTRQTLAILAAIVAMFFPLAPRAAYAQPSQPAAWRWRFIAGGPAVGWPATDGGERYYFTSEDRYLYALDSTGVMAWRLDLARRSTGQVSVGPDGSVYVVLENGRLIAVNKDGRLLWETALEPGQALAPVVLTSGLVIASDATGRVIARTHAGVPVWELEIGESVSCLPVADYHGHILFGTVAGNLITLDVSGRVVERRYLSHTPSTLAPHPDGVFAGTTSGHLLNVGLDGEPKWRVDLGSAVDELVAGPDEHTYALLDDGSLAHVSGAGVATWRANPAPARVRSIAAADGVLVAISGGSLAHIRTDGTLSWQFRLPADPLRIAPTGWGQLVVTGLNWVSYSYPLEVAWDAAWPLPRGGPGATGLAPGTAVRRSPVAEHGSSFDYIYLSEFIRSPFEADQLKGLREVASRITHSPDPAAGKTRVSAELRGSYPYVLDLCEEVAGAPYYGPVGYDTGPAVSRNARSLALTILGDIGDLGTARYLLRLLRAEEAVDMRAEILDALAALGTGVNGEVARTVGQVIAEDVAGDRSNRLAMAAISCLEAVHAYEGGFLSADAVVLLMDIAGGPYDRIVRDTAAETLSRLSSK